MTPAPELAAVTVSSPAPGRDGRLLRVVLVDPRPERRQLVRHLVESTGLVTAEIGEAADAAEAVELLRGNDRDVAVVEIQMPVSQGLETVAALRRESPDVRIVVCSFEADPAVKERALAEGADAYLDKPASAFSLTAVLRRLFPEPAPPD